MPGLDQLGASWGRATVLPDQRFADRLAGRAVPGNNRLALIGDADRRNFIPTTRGGDHFASHFERLGPNFRRVMFDLAGFRIMLVDWTLGRSGDGPVGPEQHRPGRRR